MPPPNWITCGSVLPAKQYHVGTLNSTIVYCEICLREPPVGRTQLGWPHWHLLYCEGRLLDSVSSLPHLHFPMGEMSSILP